MLLVNKQMLRLLSRQDIKTFCFYILQVGYVMQVGYVIAM